MTPARNSVLKSDILTRSELLCCALAALGLHVLLIFIFCKEQSLPSEQTSGNRTNILFAENDPNFKQISQKINAAPDPAQFIRGGSTGYSSCYRFEVKPEPESKDELPGSPETELIIEEPSAPELDRTYADMLQYSPQAEPSSATASGGRDEKKVRYPMWKDAFGILQNYSGYNSTISINSSTISGPTVLKILFPHKKSKDMPVIVTVHLSCGDTFLDDYAKKILLEQIANPDFLKKFNPEYNDLVYIYWQPDLKHVEQQDAFPQNMFPGETL